MAGQKMRRTIPPARQGNIEATDDGRVLGEDASRFVPKAFRKGLDKGPATRMTRQRMPAKTGKRSTDEYLEIRGDQIKAPKDLNQVVFNTLIGAMRVGMTQTAAANLAGVPVHLLSEWISRGEEGEAPYNKIVEAIRYSEAELQQRLLKAVIDAGSLSQSYVEEVTEDIEDDTGKRVIKKKRIQKQDRPKWGAAAWLLERLNPAYRLEQPDQNEAKTNSPEQDLLMMQGVTLGIVQAAIPQAVPKPIEQDSGKD